MRLHLEQCSLSSRTVSQSLNKAVSIFCWSHSLGCPTVFYNSRRRGDCNYLVVPKVSTHLPVLFQHFQILGFTAIPAPILDLTGDCPLVLDCQQTSVSSNIAFPGAAWFRLVLHGFRLVLNHSYFCLLLKGALTQVKNGFHTPILTGMGMLSWEFSPTVPHW